MRGRYYCTSNTYASILLRYSVVYLQHTRAAVWCNLDPCGLICAAITYGLVAYSQYAVTVCVVGQWLGYSSFFGVLHVVVFNALACLAHASHARAMMTDPGAVSSRALVRMGAAQSFLFRKKQCCVSRHHSPAVSCLMRE